MKQKLHFLKKTVLLILYIQMTLLFIVTVFSSLLKESNKMKWNQTFENTYSNANDLNDIMHTDEVNEIEDYFVFSDSQSLQYKKLVITFSHRNQSIDFYNNYQDIQSPPPKY